MDESSAASAESPPARLREGRPSLCVINFNGESVLEECLRTATPGADEVDEIVLIDNASEDGSVELVEQQFPSVRVVRLEENRGPGAARNVALREARADRVLLLDNDVSLEPGCARSLSRALDHVDSAVVAMPAVIYRSQRDRVQYDGAQSHFLGLMTIENENVPVDDLVDNVREIGSVISACILVDRSCCQAGEAFNESFFIYQEDHDFGFRTRALGFKILSVPAARCLHGAGTEDLSIRRLGAYAERRVFYLVRNRWLFVLGNYSWRTLVLLFPVLLFYELAQLVISIKKGWSRPWFRALGSVLSRLPAVVSTRRRFRRLRRVPDRELLIGGPVPLRAELTSSPWERRAKELLDTLVVTYWRFIRSWL